jgi:hypothetical protein
MEFAATRDQALDGLEIEFVHERTDIVMRVPPHFDTFVAVLFAARAEDVASGRIEWGYVASGHYSASAKVWEIASRVKPPQEFLPLPPPDTLNRHFKREVNHLLLAPHLSAIIEPKAGLIVEEEEARDLLTVEEEER